MHLELRHLQLINAAVARTAISTMYDALEFSKNDSTLKGLSEHCDGIDVYDAGRHRFINFHFGEIGSLEVHVGPKPDRPKIGAPAAGPDSPDPTTPGTTIPTALAA